MTNALYDKARESFLKGELSWSNDTIKCALVDLDDYTPDLANDQFLSEIPSGAIVAVSQALSNKTTVAGVADADDALLSAVAGDTCEAIVLFQDTGTPSTSKLIGLIDTAAGLPIEPNGGDLTVVWDAGANKIFKL